MRRSGIFLDKRPFEVDWVPPRNEILYRDEPLNTMNNYLSDSLQGVRPHHLLGFGRFGCGKTVCVQRACKDIAETALNENLDVHVVYVNCSDRNTCYRVLRDAIIQLGEPVKMGFPGDFYQNWFKKCCSEHDYVFLILDEIDKLLFNKYGQHEELLYFLTRTTRNVSLILLTNRMLAVEFIQTQLDPRVRDTLRPRIVSFDDYSIDELYGIGSERVKMGLRPGACNEEVLEEIATIAFNKGLGARGVVDLIRGSGELAENDGLNEILKAHVRDFSEYNQIEKLMAPIQRMDPGSRVILTYICNNMPIPRPRVFDFFKREIAGKKVRGLSPRAFSDLLNKLIAQDYVSETVRGLGRGKGQERILFIPQHVNSIVEDALKSFKKPDFCQTRRMDKNLIKV